MGDAIDFDRIRDGDEVWVRGTWRGHLNGDRFALVDLGNCGSRTIITRSAIAGHVPKSWVPEVGDVVEYLSDERECVILGIDEDKAWLKGGGYRFVASFDRLTLIRKGGEK